MRARFSKKSRGSVAIGTSTGAKRVFRDLLALWSLGSVGMSMLPWGSKLYITLTNSPEHSCALTANVYEVS